MPDNYNAGTVFLSLLSDLSVDISGQLLYKSIDFTLSADDTFLLKSIFNFTTQFASLGGGKHNGRSATYEGTAEKCVKKA